MQCLNDPTLGMLVFIDAFVFIFKLLAKRSMRIQKNGYEEKGYKKEFFFFLHETLVIFLITRFWMSIFLDTLANTYVKVWTKNVQEMLIKQWSAFDDMSSSAVYRPSLKFQFIKYKKNESFTHKNIQTFFVYSMCCGVIFVCWVYIYI